MRDTLEEHNGYLYNVMHDNQYDEPIRTHAWYPIGVRARDYPRDISEQLVSEGHGIMRCPSSGKRYRLTNGGQTLPEFTISEPIPCPTTRVETRYVRGHWEKLLKSQGWVIA